MTRTAHTALHDDALPEMKDNAPNRDVKRSPLQQEVSNIDFTWSGAVHGYFNSRGFNYWPDVADLGGDMMSSLLELDTKIEIDSPLDNVISGVAAHSANSVFHSVALCLGVSTEAVQDVLATWYEGLSETGPPPPPISAEELHTRLHSSMRERLEIIGGAKA